jgi:hypothetical protein
MLKRLEKNTYKSIVCQYKVQVDPAGLLSSLLSSSSCLSKLVLFLFVVLAVAAAVAAILLLLLYSIAGSGGYIREGDPKGWSTVVITVLDSWEKPVPRGHSMPYSPS